MRNNYYPTEEDVLSGLDPSKARELITSGAAKKAIENAILDAEAKLGEPLRTKTKQAHVVMNRGQVLLPDFPVTRLTLENCDQALYALNPREGIVEVDLPKIPFWVTYEVGYRDGEVPAPVQMLVEALARQELREDKTTREAEEEREQIKIYTQVQLASRARTKKVRDDIEAS